MKRNVKWIILAVLAVATSCETIDSWFNKGEIVYNTVNEEFILSTNMETLLVGTSTPKSHTDSILSGLIDAELISTGERFFDLNGNSAFDIGFEIVDLHKLNLNRLPDYLDSLAARVIPMGIEIHDNSTWGYVSALQKDDVISGDGNWRNSSGVLGTFGNAGQFQGEGERFLAIRFPDGNKYQYGWVRIYCSQHSDTLRIIDYAYNKLPNSKIKAGQKE